MRRLLLGVVSLMVLSQSLRAEGLMLHAVIEPARYSFTDALKIAFERNDELKRVDAQLRIANSEMLSSLSRLLPKLSTKLTYETPSRVPGSPGDGDASFGLSAQVSLLDAKSLVNVKAKREGALAAKDKLRHQRDVLIYEVGVLYVEAAIAQALTENALEEREVFQKQLAILDRKSLVGQARNLDIRRAQFLSAKAYSEYLLKRQDAQKKLGALGRKIGVTDYFLLSDLSIFSPHLSKDADTLREMAKTSAEIAMLNREYAAASYAKVSEGFDLLPRLNATFDCGWQTPTLSNKIVDVSPQFGARTMLMLELPLFSGGNTLASVKIATARQSIASVNLETKLMEKTLGINSALTELNDLEVVTTNAQIALDAAVLAKESAQRLFDNNEATGLELVEANTNHFSAKNLLANSRLGLERVKLHVLFIIGAISDVIAN